MFPDPGLEPVSPASPALAGRFSTSCAIYLYFIKRGLVAHSQPVCGIAGGVVTANQFNLVRRLPIWNTSTPQGLRSQPFPRPPGPHPHSDANPMLKLFPGLSSTCLKVTFPQAHPSGAHRAHWKLSPGSRPICNTRKQKTHRVRGKDAQGNSYGLSRPPWGLSPGSCPLPLPFWL